jgi:simple sugar transport system ATP-binding protein
MRTQRSGATAGPEVLAAIDLVKSYGRTQALRGASVVLHGGEIVGLVGDNGAGKSTLVKSIAGVIRPDSGTVRIAGEGAPFAGALSVRLRGVETVHQDLGLCDNLTVYENIYLGRELRTYGVLARRRMRRGATTILRERLGVDRVPVERRPNQLSGGQRQLVALARAEAWDARALLLDEPTAALSADATKRVVAVIERLRDRGAGILLISHDIPQVMDLCDRVVVLRQGACVANASTGAGLTTEMVLGLMTGAIHELERGQKHAMG